MGNIKREFKFTNRRIREKRVEIHLLSLYISVLIMTILITIVIGRFDISGGRVLAALDQEERYLVSYKDVDLYKRYVDNKDVILMANDIVVDDDDMDKLLKDDKIERFIIDKSNFLMFKSSNLQVLQTDRLSVDCKNLKSAASTKPYNIKLGCNDTFLEIRLWVLEYVSPDFSISPDNEEVPIIREPEKEDKRETGNIINQVVRIETEEPPMQEGLQDRSKPTAKDKSYKIIVVDIDAIISSLDVKAIVKEVAKASTDIDMNMVLEFAGKHAYVGSFGLSILIFALIGVDAIYNFKVIFWYKRKLKEREKKLSGELEEKLNKSIR